MQIVEREAAPGSAKKAQPGNAVVGIEQGAGQGERVEDFGAGCEFFEIDGTEGNLSLAQGLGDRDERFAGAGENSDAVFFFVCLRFINAAHLIADQVNDFVDLLFVSIFHFAF